MTQRLHLEVRKAFECPWQRNPVQGTRYCEHPVSPVQSCDKANEPPPNNCPIRKAPILVEVVATPSVTGDPAG